MFSELCRETLRKAAVYYSSGRAGSPSPSPPSSPPPSPAKEPKSPTRTHVSTTNHSTTDVKHVVESSRTRDFREKRPAMPTDFSKRSRGRERRQKRRYVSAEQSRSLSPEIWRDERRESDIVRHDYRSYSSESEESSTSDEEAGSAPEENSQRSSSAHRYSLAKDQTMHWFAHVGGNEPSFQFPDQKRRSGSFDEDSLDGDRPDERQGRESSASAKDVDRAKLVRDRQNEERQRKLDEMRQQALAAQRFREQREEERRRRIEELRSRDNDRRNQVEERKRLIYEAERERREAILRKNQEREARIEARRKNERSHIVFAFGSSTPRMLEPADTGGASYWGARRATSTTNVMMFSAAQPLTRRSSERELEGSKKRATSAGGLDRKPGEGIRSGEATPNSPSRPPSSMSQQSGSSVGSSNVILRPRTATTPRRPRPASIAGTGVTVTERHNSTSDIKSTKDSKPPLPKVQSTPKKLSTPKALDSVRKSSEKLVKNVRASPRATPRATPLQSPGVENVSFMRDNQAEIIKSEKKAETADKHEEKKDQGSEKKENGKETVTTEPAVQELKKPSPPNQEASATVKPAAEDEQPTQPNSVTSAEKKGENKGDKKSPEAEAKSEQPDLDEECDMSASMIAKVRITTEEEAKAALAERRRLAREQAEREAELERQRQEEQDRLEAERLRAEEEEQRRLEEETIRLANEAREAEEQRLRQAIEEAERREVEDKLKREEEARQKQEKEEAERKAREEAERQRIQNEARLRREEEERIERRKRVEAIMLRTRGRGQSNSTAKEETDEKSKEDHSPEYSEKSSPENKVDDVMTASLISEATQQFITSEQTTLRTENNGSPDIVHNGTHANGLNDSKTILDNKIDNSDNKELNGHHVNIESDINSQTIPLDNASVKQNNVTNLLDLSEFDTLCNSSNRPILGLTPNLANEDSLNSNLNPAAVPFTPMANPFVPAATNINTNPFQDAFTNNRPQDNQVPDLLS